MIDPELAAKLDEIAAKVDAAYHAAESARKYLFWGRVIAIILIVLPLIGLAWLVPPFLASYSNALSNF